MNKLLRKIIIVFIFFGMIVILGAFLKIYKHEYANLMLIIGMIGETILGTGTMIYLLFNKNQ